MITTTWRDTVAVLEMNRPERRNALSAELCRGLLDAFDEAESGGARAVVLTGEGSSFCAGADLAILTGDAYIPLLVGMLRRVVDFPVPVIAAVNGPALGAGTQLAVCADLRVGAPSAVFGLPTAKLGAAAEAWTIRRLALVAGSSAARMMALAGRRVDLAGALACGLVDEPGDLAAALALADEVAQLAPLSLRYSKRVLAEALEPEFDPAWAGEAVTEAWLSEDFAEGKAAMAEKRPARFTGR